MVTPSISEATNEPKSASGAFDYENTFKVNYGILSSDEQSKVRQARVTILGTGGVGGIIAIILARCGVGHFILIDPDRYTETNTNRQIGCFQDTLGEYKAEVIKRDILRINPEASIEVYAKKLSFESVDEILDLCDVFAAEADDLAYSTIAILMAQKKKKYVVSQTPSGLAGYIMAFPPDPDRIIDPIDLFGGPAGLPYEELYTYIASPLNKFGRRWYITQGKWRIEWFNKWRKNELLLLPLSKWCFNYNIWKGDTLACAGINPEPLVPLTQLCPTIWLGAALASMEAIKYVTGKGKLVKAPRMWHYQLGDNRIRVEKFRQRSRFFFKLMNWGFNLKLWRLGEKLRQNTIKQLEKELAAMEAAEKAGRELKPPWLWRYVI
jgi:molybdopterin/thiamine biosynthesis adenylyltransferase